MTTTITYSPEQEAAIDSAVRWRKSYQPNGNVSQCFTIFGGAGTGKTTIAQEIAHRMGGLVTFAAFTGKAALRLREKGCQDTSTIHGLIYIPKEASMKRLDELRDQLLTAEGEEKRDERAIAELQTAIEKEEDNLARPKFKLNLASDIEYAYCVVIDEMSMINDEMGRDLLSFGVPLLVMGDPYQLPPIGQEVPFFAKRDPEVQLNEIHRQAQESSILKVANLVREGSRPSQGERHDVRVLHERDLSPEDYASFDQVLVGRNATRARINDAIRNDVLKRKTPYPEPGDKLVCCRNDIEAGLLNGGLWKVDDVLFQSDDGMRLAITSYEGVSVHVTIHKHPFDERRVPLYERMDRQHFEFGYALTVHKAQGSEWPSVLVVDESQCFRSAADKWLYTAVTRASQHLTLAR